MKDPFIGARPILAMALLGVLWTGCTKERMEPAQASVASESPGDPKIPQFFVKSNTGTGTFTVYKWFPTCVEGYGNITYWDAYAPGSLVTTGTPSYVRANPGSCTIDPNYLRLQRGATVGSYGPWYLIKPDFGPPANTRAMLRVRVKNVSPVLSNSYNMDFKYDAPSNDWTWSASTPDSYEVVEFVPGTLSVCPPR